MPDNRPILTEIIDLNAPLDTFRRTLIVGTDSTIQFQFRRGPIAEPITGGTVSLVLYNANGGDEWTRTFTGTNTDAANGICLVHITDTGLDLVGTHSAQLTLTDANGWVVCWQEGEIIVKAKLSGNPTPALGFPIDWEDYTAYVNTATHGPYRAGTGITFDANPDGSVDINATPGGGVTSDDVGNDSAVTGATVTAALNALNTGKLSTSATAADVNPSGTSIAAALAGKAATTAIYVTGTDPSGATAGSIRAAKEPSGSVAGNARGAGAVDLQQVRASATNVASGTGAAIIGGQNNIASGDYSTASGDGSSASGFGSIAKGIGAIAEGRASEASGEGALAAFDHSRALGYRAKAVHAGATVISDGQDADAESAAENELALRFAGGVRLTELTASRPVSLDANKRMVTLSLADYRTLIECQRTAVVVSGNTTAVLDTLYHGTATATFTDPSPVEGRGFWVRVVNGTQTVGGTAYAAEGTVVFREFHSGSWRNRVLFGGADAAGVRTNLDLGTMSTQAASAVAITGGAISGITDLAVADGGTGASTAANARTNLGLAIGSDVLAYNANVQDLADKNAAGEWTFANLILGNSSAYFAAQDAAVKSSLRIAIANQAAEGAYLFVEAAGGAAPGILTYGVGGSNASPTATVSGQFIGLWSMRGRGSSTTSVVASSYVAGVAAQNWTNTAQGSELRFATTKNGTASAAVRLKITNDGGLEQAFLAADPADPPSGSSVQWVSDGTGSGDAGDVMMKINVGGTVKTITVVDWSAM
jgi:hypothetical protein